MATPIPFTWQGADDDELVVKTIRISAVAVYINQNGDISIRQQCDPDAGEQSDPVVEIPMAAVPRLIKLLQNLQAD